MKYYAIAQVGGCVSVRLGGRTIKQAMARWQSGPHRHWIDQARQDLDDDLGADLAHADPADLRRLGCRLIVPLEPVDNYHSGTQQYLSGSWGLWAGPARPGS